MTRPRFLILVLAMVLIPVAVIGVALVRMRSFPTSMHIIIKDDDAGAVLCSGIVNLRTHEVHYRWQREWPFIIAYSSNLTAVSSLDISPTLIEMLDKKLENSSLIERCATLLTPHYVDSTGELDLIIGIHRLGHEGTVSLHWKTSPISGEMGIWHSGRGDSGEWALYPITITDVQR